MRTLAEYHVCPIYAHILLGADVSPEIAAASRELEQESIRRTAELFLRVAPHLGEQRAWLSATVVKAIIKSLVSLLTASNDLEYRRQIIIEFKRLLLEMKIK